MTPLSSKYLLGAAALTAALATSTQAEAQTKRVTLNVLVLARGNDAGTAMVRAGLDEALVPYTVVDRRSPRPSSRTRLATTSAAPSSRPWSCQTSFSTS